METAAVTLRRAKEADFDEWFDLFESVAGEGRWIGRELPLDREEHRQRFLDNLGDGNTTAAFLAQAGGRQVGYLAVHSRIGLGDIAMLVAAPWRGRGVGSALMTEAISWGREGGLHKLTLQVWPHNAVAIRLYERFGFVEEGRLRRHYRRRNGELWDAVIMGLVLDETSPGSSV